MSQAFLITGTDTGVGKTWVTASLIEAGVMRGLRVAGMKPVAAGCTWVDGRLLSEDVALLEAVSNVKLAPEIVNPYAFEPAIAPHIAAARARVEIDLAQIRAAFLAMRAQVDWVLVEGVGGFRVPLKHGCDTADMAVMLGLPVILVVGLRLGCLNHALLTAEAIAARGLSLAGWVANTLDPHMAALEENVAALDARIPAPRLALLPYRATREEMSLQLLDAVDLLLDPGAHLPGNAP